MGGGGLALYVVVWLTVCLFELPFLGVEASFKWMPGQSNLSHSHYKKESQLSRFTV